MKRLLQTLYSLILKCLTVKGIFFFTSVYLTLTGRLEGLYTFIAGSLWVGARELYKHLIESKKENKVE